MVAGAIIVFLLLGGIVFLRSKRPVNTVSQLPPQTEEVIPTIDSSVKVDLISKTPGREVSITIASIPAGTQTVEYSLSYATKQQGIQGVIGTVHLEPNQSTYKKDLVLGTCSSGTCVYHQVEGKITLNLKFSGSYGSKIFEKEYKF